MINKNKPPVNKRVILITDTGKWTSGCLTEQGWYKTFDFGGGDSTIDGKILEKIVGYIDVGELLSTSSHK